MRYNIKKIFSENIKHIRARRRLTQEKFGEAAGMDWKTITNYESGRNIPNASSLEKFCNVLDVAPSELFFMRSEDEEAQTIINKILVKLNKIKDKQKLKEVYRIVSVLEDDSHFID